MSETITRELIEQSVQENKEFIKMVCSSKYNHDNLKDVIEGVIKYCGITDEKQKELMRSGKFIPAGSILSKCNTETQASMSNCYLTPIESDSLTGIFECQKDLANTARLRGGSGFDITILRPAGCSVDNSAKTSTGSVSFLPSFSEVGKVVGQGGRRMAMICSQDIRHPDVLSLAWCKARPENVFSVDTFNNTLPDISSMNISIKITNEFMLAVKEDRDWPFIFPDIDYDKEFYNDHWIGDYDKWAVDGGTVKEYSVMKARDVLSQVAEAAHICGDPGLIFIDTAQENTFGTYINDKLKPTGTNPCQPADATVLTPERISTIGEISIGDKIWSQDGWVRVINKVNTGFKDVKKYTTTCGSFIGTENHRIMSRGSKIEVKDADCIDNIQGDGDSIITHYPEAIMDGLLIGDGSVHAASNNLIYLCIGQDDIDYLDSEINHLLKNHRPGLSDCAWEVKTNLSYKEIPKTYLRCVPERYKFGTQSDVASFLRGLYSANGSALEKHGRITLKASSIDIINDVQIMLSSIGIGSYYTTNKSKRIIFSNGEYDCKQSYDLNITTDYKIFRDKIGFIQKHKTDKLNRIKKKIQFKFKKTFDIINKEFIANEEVFDLTVNGVNHTYWSGGLNVSNCGEQNLAPYNNCLLGAFNLQKYYDNCIFDYDVFRDDVRIATQLMNIFSDINQDKHPLIEQIDADILGKRIGIEFTGFGDLCASLNIGYGSKDSQALAACITNEMVHSAIDESIELAKEYGACQSLNSVEKRTKFLSTCTFKRDIIDAFYSDILEFGMANTAFLTLGPTGSLSILADNCTSGIEPLYKFSYKRKNRIDGKEYSFIHYPACIKMLDNFDEYEGLTLEEAKNRLYYIEADEVDTGDKINLISAAQANIDASISNTTNLHNSASKEDIYNLYIKAWEKNLKGITVFRDGCKDGVLSDNTCKEVVSQDTPKCQMYEKELLPVETAERHIASWKKGKIYVNVSLDDEEPLEVFCKLPLECGHDKDNNFNPSLWMERTSQWDLTSRLISMCLRYGIDLEEVLKQLDRSSYSMVDSAGILGRVLRRYIKSEEYIEVEGDEGSLGSKCPECSEMAYVRDGGCLVCKSCGYSRCG